jgi:hypothetical protein
MGLRVTQLQEQGCKVEFRDTYQGICVDKLVLHESSFIVEADFRLKFSVREVFSTGIIKLHHVLLICKVLLSSKTLARWSSERRRWEVFLIVEAIREVAIVAKSITLPHDSGFLYVVEGDRASPGAIIRR